MRILIHDASVLIDLIAVDLLEVALTLPYGMETTDLVKNEILRARQGEVLDRVVASRQLDIIRSSIEEIDAIAHLQASIPALSLADCSVIFHATAKGAVVLSGDGLLRRTAQVRSLTVHGTLWILSELVTQNYVNEIDAAAALERLMEINRRLPRTECLKLLSHWRHT